MPAVGFYLVVYMPMVAFATLILVGFIGIAAQAQYSRLVKARYGEEVPSSTFGNRTQGLLSGLRILFSNEAKAPPVFAVTLFFYRLLALLLIAEVLFMLWTRIG